MKAFFETKNGGFAQAGVEGMAKRREKRVFEQREMLARGGEDRCVVCVGMNIAGPMKRSGLIDAAFLNAVSCFIRKAGIERPLNESENGAELRFVNENTGIEALIALDANAEDIKRICVEIEESHQVGRLFDIDVIAKSGAKLGRTEPRKCLICSENASVCARSRAHSVKELQDRTAELLEGYFAALLADIARAALVSEVNVTPKPGLVDRLNSGANADMDIELFHRSAEALRPFFARMAALTIRSVQAEETEAAKEKYFSELKKLGIQAESAMLGATGGVNTHRGAIYSLGLLVCSAARIMARGVFAADESGLRGICADGLDLSEALLRTAANLALALGDNSVSTSNGAKTREKYGVGGPVQQAQSGFPLAMLAKAAKAEYYNRYGAEGAELAWAFALIAVMAVMDDNNALKRGGMEGARFVKDRAEELRTLAEREKPEAFRDLLLEFDSELIKRNISCGGAADMLALALFIEGFDALFAPAMELLLKDRTRGGASQTEME